ncbi:MFS transporter [Streptomyces sp. MUM 2J]|uniref:MFS transporter n=1 Tax=Streptomyces sp. MUM 2J TaxID=2791987 RepID=UPI001F04DCE6|nr:MFS transporter [Streptomyces sp. MUM 2J]MCH0566156.1 MFS transporter [Streptomyces sp. MUM 2J]
MNSPETADAADKRPTGSAATTTQTAGRSKPRLRALLTSFAFANLADGFTLVTLPLLAAETSRSALAVGTVAACRMVPWALLAPALGVFADRSALRAVLQGANLLRASSLVLVAVAVAGGWLNIPILAAGALLVGIGEVLYDVSAQTALPAIVSADELESANSKQTVLGELLNGMIGPALGGMIMAVSASWSLLSSAALYAMAILAAMRLPRLAAERSESVAGYLPSMLEGFRAIWRNPLLRVFMLMTAFGALTFAGWQPLFALFATDKDLVGLDSFHFGLVYSIGSLGGIALSVAAPRLIRWIPRVHMLTASQLLGGVFLALPVFVPTFLMASIALAGYSACVIMWNVITVSYRQRSVPRSILGRVNASYRALAWGLMPLGPLLGGAASSATDSVGNGLLALVVLSVSGALFLPAIYRHRHALASQIEVDHARD